jgi:probable phosphoglycerate mutase
MNTKRHLVGGRSNLTPPTELGLVQAKQFGLYLRNAGIMPDAVYSSGAIRTNATARVALRAAGISMDIIEDERLLEMSQGSAEGKPRELMYTPENKEKYQIETMEGKFPGGESLLDLQLRNREFLDEKHIEHPSGLVLVFGHGLAIRALVGHVRGSTRDQILGEDIKNVSETRIDVVDGHPEVLYLGKNVISE